MYLNEEILQTIIALRLLIGERYVTTVHAIVQKKMEEICNDYLSPMTGQYPMHYKGGTQEIQLIIDSRS